MHARVVLAPQVSLPPLLEADRPTLRLLARDPFEGARPQWVRARVFHYRFSTGPERRETGLWWIRTEAGTYPMKEFKVMSGGGSMSIAGGQHAN